MSFSMPGKAASTMPSCASCEALACVARCDVAGIPVYFGGMFEVGAGRRQLWDLAALLAPDGPNDIAPIAVGEAPPRRPARLVVDVKRAGFGA